MTIDALFCSLSPLRIAELIRSAQRAVCYAAPGIQLNLAQAMVDMAVRLGKEMLTVSLDFDERVMRMGYGDIKAVTLLLNAGIAVQSSPGLRTALIVVDNEGYVFTPAALYLEPSPPMALHPTQCACRANRLRRRWPGFHRLPKRLPLPKPKPQKPSGRLQL